MPKPQPKVAVGRSTHSKPNQAPKPQPRAAVCRSTHTKPNQALEAQPRVAVGRFAITKPNQAPKPQPKVAVGRLTTRLQSHIFFRPAPKKFWSPSIPKKFGQLQKSFGRPSQKSFGRPSQKIFGQLQKSFGRRSSQKIFLFMSGVIVLQGRVRKSSSGGRSRWVTYCRTGSHADHPPVVARGGSPTVGRGRVPVILRWSLAVGHLRWDGVACRSSSDGRTR